eukprot:gnl/MRDRNA2_/MRDRNA2_123924_c0_seq1.p1 gnl/MRDRNA2_/MRDRNA2_123924_c0~~gnl/MRDRNA2_/MRDRNA2_123924_c0_seq1.p1  ORF type:complete len:432 (-),score=79.65 gnl/MRDRNA2_/MRDRNA2_123924_c0_seq1:174-1469(-)
MVVHLFNDLCLGNDHTHDDGTFVLPYTFIPPFPWRGYQNSELRQTVYKHFLATSFDVHGDHSYIEKEGTPNERLICKTNKCELGPEETFDSAAVVDAQKFACCPNLKKVRLGPNVTEIGDYAFQCKGDNPSMKSNKIEAGLEEIVGGENVTKIGKKAFKNCDHLKIAHFPKLTTMGEQAFREAFDPNVDAEEGKVALDIGKVTELPWQALEKCGAKTIKGLETVNKLGFYALRGCGVKKLEMPGLTGDDWCSKTAKPFAEMPNLEEVKMENITKIPTEAFKKPGLQVITEESFPKVGQIKQDAFSYGQLKEVTMNQVQFVGAGVFRKSKQLQKISMPECKYVGKQAFEDDAELETADLPNVKKICKLSFKGCKKLTKESTEKWNLCKKGGNAFKKVPGGGPKVKDKGDKKCLKDQSEESCMSGGSLPDLFS